MGLDVRDALRNRSDLYPCSRLARGMRWLVCGRGAAAHRVLARVAQRARYDAVAAAGLERRRGARPRGGLGEPRPERLARVRRVGRRCVLLGGLDGRLHGRAIDGGPVGISEG
jgi:hypothetical protein